MMAPMSADPVSYWPAFPGKKPPLSSTPLPATPKPANNKNFNQSSTISQQIKLIAILPHEHNAAFPGTFNQTLNRLLRCNHIKKVDVGDDWPSAAILAAMPAQDATIVSDSPSPPPATGAVFLSNWPEHELSFSEPSTPTSAISSEDETGEKKEKNKQEKTLK